MVVNHKEELEQKDLQFASLKPSMWLKYIDDIFLIVHMIKNSCIFFSDTSTNPQEVEFMMKIQENGQLLFLSTLTIKRQPLCISLQKRRLTPIDFYKLTQPSITQYKFRWSLVQSPKNMFHQETFLLCPQSEYKNNIYNLMHSTKLSPSEQSHFYV